MDCKFRINNFLINNTRVLTTTDILKDIAVLTNNPKKCKYYQNESENVKGRWYCVVPNGYITNTGGLIPNNQIDCEVNI